MNLIILNPDEVSQDSLCHLEDGRAEHIVMILKAKAGDRLEIGIINGPQGTAVVESVHEGKVVLKLEKMKTIIPIRPEVRLICALPRPQTLKKILFTAAMMRVERCDFIRARRVERSYYQSPLLQPENMRRFLIEGLSQGKHTRLPEIHLHDRFRNFIEDVFPTLLPGKTVESCLCLLPHPDSSETISYHYRPVGQVLLAIGPEGGWVDFELDKLKSAGLVPVTLGNSILRVEHAVTAALAQIEMLRLENPDT